MEDMDPRAFYFVIAALAVLVALIRRGSLRREALADGPPRDVNLGLSDLFVWYLLFFLGALALHGVVLKLGIGPDPAKKGEPVPPWVVAKLALLNQAFMEVPVVVFLVVRLRSQPDGLRRAGLLPRNPWEDIRAAGAALLAAIPLPLGLSVLTMWIGYVTGHPAPRVGHDMLKAIGESTSTGAVAVLLFSAVVVAPLLEEIIFRGLLQTALLNTLGRAKHWAVVLIAAALFAVFHLGSVTWHGLPALFVLGIILGWLYEKHGSLLPCVLVHVGFNALNAGWVLLFNSPQGHVYGG